MAIVAIQSDIQVCVCHSFLRLISDESERYVLVNKFYLFEILLFIIKQVNSNDEAKVVGLSFKTETKTVAFMTVTLSDGSGEASVMSMNLTYRSPELLISQNGCQQHFICFTKYILVTDRPDYKKADAVLKRRGWNLAYRPRQKKTITFRIITNFFRQLNVTYRASGPFRLYE